jgi:hypothetical protein
VNSRIANITNGANFRMTIDPQREGDTLSKRPLYAIPIAFATIERIENVKQIWKLNNYLNMFIDNNDSYFRFQKT